MEQAIKLIEAIPSGSIVIPVQVLGELFNVLTRKSGASRTSARVAVLEWHNTYPAVDTSIATLQLAIDLATDHHLRIWDAIIVATAADAGCQVLLSEDMQHGFAWNGVTIVNPFALPRHPLLHIALRG
jgi:predicted nucleic acid-binding protein